MRHTASAALPLLIFSFFAVLPAGVLAQTRCPPGAAPGSVQCQPDDAVDGEVPRTVTKYVGRWEKTWGALAESNNSVGGSSSGQLSEKAAKLSAAENCRSRGGKSCRAYFSYFNQCVAVANPVNGGTSNTTSAATLSAAQLDSVGGCKKDNAGQCVVVFSECTQPIFYGD